MRRFYIKENDYGDNNNDKKKKHTKSNKQTNRSYEHYVSEI